jgi:hypothetical protein
MSQVNLGVTIGFGCQKYINLGFWVQQAKKILSLHLSIKEEGVTYLPK